MYAPLALFGTASTLFLYRSAYQGKSVNWTMFGLTAAATAHSHNYGLLLVAAQAVWGVIVLLWQRENRLLWGSALSLAVFVVSYGPMIPALVTQMQMSVGSTEIAKLSNIVDFFEAFGSGFMGFSTPGLTPGQLIRRTAGPSAAATWALALLGLLANGTESNAENTSLAFSKGCKALLLGTCSAFPVVFVYGYSALMQKAVWQIRGFQMALGCFALLIGAGVSSLRPRLLRWVTCLSLMGGAAANLYPHYFDRYKSTVPDAVAALEGKLGPEDILFVAPYWTWTPFRYHYRGEAAAVGGWQQGDTLHPVAVGIDYADLVDPQSLLDIQSNLSRPIIPPSQFRPDDYARVWAVGHGATPQQILKVFGDDISIMHYDAERRHWRGIVYPAGTPPPELVSNVSTSSLRWDNGLRLLGYTWQPFPVVGREARLSLFWISEHPQTCPSRLKVQLIDNDGETVLERQETMLSLMHGLPVTSLGIRSEFPTTAWPVGSIIVQDLEFDIPPDLPPLPYRVNLQVVDKESGEAVAVAGETMGSLDCVSVTRPLEPYRPEEIAMQHREAISFGGQIGLLGYDLPKASPRPGHYLPVWLHWRAKASPSVDYEVQLRLLGSDGELVTEIPLSPLNTSFPTSMWRSGDLIQGEFTIPLPPDTEGGQYRLAIRLTDSETQDPLLGRRPWGLRSREWIVMGKVRVLPWSRLNEPPAMQHEVDGEFGRAAELLGYDLTGRSSPGEEVTITLYWKVRTSLDKSYSVFIHLTDETGKPVAQADGIPGEWLRPTTTWREGEVIIDRHTLRLPPRLAPGAYPLYVGFYQPGGQRSPVVVRGQPLPEGKLPLEHLRVEESE